MKKFLLYLPVILSFNIYAQSAPTDSIKVWNGIWDPNDPLCPCHEIQKQADEEFKKLNKDEKTVQKDVIKEVKQDKNKEEIKYINTDKNIIQKDILNDTLEVKINEIKNEADQREGQENFKKSDAKITQNSLANNSSVANKKHKQNRLKKLSFKTKRKIYKLFKKQNKRGKFSDECIAWKL